MQSRRGFLKGFALAGTASAAGGAAGGWWPFGGTAGSPMHGYAAPALPHIRLGVVGMGSRGCGIVNRASRLPGITITAICDNVKEKVDRAQKMLADRKKSAAKEYLGDAAWQRLCDDPNVDVVYNTTPWALHVPVQLAAMRGGKHVFTEVPSAFTVDECWRFDENRVHGGNRYPTHGLVPLCLTFDVNRGDRLDYLVSLESNQANFRAYMEANLAADNKRRLSKVRMADMNSTLIKTAKGKSLLIQHDVSTPRPYSRIQLVTGTKGSICDYPYRVVFEEKSGAGAHKWYDEKQAEEIRMKYRHPLWKTVGELAKRVGGHGGMDFIMDARWVYCLQQGLPLDMDVYDLAATSCLCELTEKSVDNRSRAYDIPDFTRGAWRTNKPMGIVDIDLAKMGFDPAAKKG